MKSKPLFIIAIVVVLVSLAVGILFWTSKKASAADDDAYKSFIAGFNKKIKNGDIDSALTFFDDKISKRPELTRILKALAGQTNSTGATKALFKPELGIETTQINLKNNSLADATVPVYLMVDGLALKTSTFELRIIRQDGKLRIIKLAAEDFLTDYLAYENLIRSKTLSDEDIYSPITLEAFKKCETLKNTYDTVLWFTHYKKQTYFYVGYGKWSIDDEGSYKKTGLVGPDLKEIIPVQYDLIHGFNTTLNGFIEVEKEKKKGLYSLNGKLIVPVEYDRIFPIQTDSTLAILQKGDNFFTFSKNLEISSAPGIKFTNVLAMLPIFKRQEITAANVDNITEINSREYHQAVYVAPSYLADLNLHKRILQIKNPLRKNVEVFDYSDKYIISAPQKATDETGNTLSAMVYSIRDYYQGGRSEFYEKKNAIVTDVESDKFYTVDLYDNYLFEEFETPELQCKDFYLKMLSDSLVEIKYSAWVVINASATDSLLEAPVYQYFKVKNEAMEPVNQGRIFACASLVKLDESYVQGCYTYSGKNGKSQTDYLKQAYYKYIINEIYASHNYIFKDKKISEAFEFSLPDYKPEHTNVENKLTEIEEYNIAWLKQKLAPKPASNVLAAK